MDVNQEKSGTCCPVARGLAKVGDAWSMLILRDLSLGLSRFEELRVSLGIAPNILTARLRRLVEHGILQERPYQERPLRVEYRLTAKGRDLYPVLVALLGWGDKWYADDGPPVVLVHADCEHRADPQLVCGHCGEKLDPRRTRAVPGRGAGEEEPSLAVSR